jgi:hypothetical protein
MLLVIPLQAATKIMAGMVGNSSTSRNKKMAGMDLWMQKNELHLGISNCRVQRHGFCDLNETLGNGKIMAGMELWT